MQPAQAHAQLVQALDLARAGDGGDIGRDMGETFEHGDAERILHAHAAPDAQRPRRHRQRVQILCDGRWCGWWRRAVRPWMPTLYLNHAHGQSRFR